jgi:hypothetical protein
MRILSTSIATAVWVLLSSQESFGFSVRPTISHRMTTASIGSGTHGSTRLWASSPGNNDDDSRRDFLTRSLATAALASGGWFTGAGVGYVADPPAAAWALTGVKKVNAKLAGYGLPLVSNVPDGLTPLLEIYGKGVNRFPVLVQFNYPVTWVVTTPSNNVNGEDGTVQAGEYNKGDTATFFLYSEPGNIKDVTTQSKEFFEKALMRSIGQKGDNMYQNFKVTKLEPTVKDGKPYMIADFKYQLLTGAGFEVDRKGVASITSQGDAVEVLWAASTAIRYKKTEETLRNIVASFRCYADGLNFSDELVGSAASRGLDG